MNRALAMRRLIIITIVVFTVLTPSVTAQVKIRLFAGRSPESVLFSVTNGRYRLTFADRTTLFLSKGEIAVIARFEGKLALKTRDSEGFVSDSVIFSGDSDEDSFSLRINGMFPVRQYYSGDLKCFPDFGSILLINKCNVEKYITGVVLAEGGTGKNVEYFKSQAVIARTYMYRYTDKHLTDGYNVCDNTHCQAFNGLSADSVLNIAAFDTRGLVILEKDSTLAITAFHSNCGGETCSSEDVWLTEKPYLKKVIDPYCLTSRNAAWERRIDVNEWIGKLKKWGYTGSTDDKTLFSLSQISRLTDYKIGSFSIPLGTIRTELNLRSTFFSVVPEEDSIILRGRGYGHGVGFCQEGAMAMAAKGFNYRQIIGFYYSGVMISDVKNALFLPMVLPSRSGSPGL